MTLGPMEAFDEALVARATSFAGLTALVGDRVYLDQAPPDAATPYLVISWQSWNTVNDRTIVDEIDATANVRAVVDVDKQGARLGVQIADQIESAFDGYALTPENGWGVHWCRQRSRFRNVTMLDRRNYAMSGSLIQIGAIRA